LAGDLGRARSQLQTEELLASLDSGSSPLLQSHLRGTTSEARKNVKRTKARIRKEVDRGHLLENLQQEYLRNGSAGAFTFSVTSGMHVCISEAEVVDGLGSIRKELADHHKYRIHQKLSGGRLNVQIQEATDPTVAWLMMWFGGGLTPRQIEAIQARAPDLAAAHREQLMVLPDQDIRVDGHTQEDKKVVAARVVRTFVGRLDETGAQDPTNDEVPEEALPVRLGVHEGDRNPRPAVFPLAQFNNMYISGATGSGKSYLGRVLLEEAAHHDVSILILDPRNQAAGFLTAEDRPSILSLYSEFGMSPSEARGFDLRYFAPGTSLGDDLPVDLGKLGAGRSIVSFKGLDDEERCTLFARILDAVFDAHAAEESSSLELLVFVEEAQRFTKKRVVPEAKSAGQRAENALDRTLREGRKYGCCTMIISQTIRDFAYDVASIRQNTNTKAFLHNSDREVDYAATFLGDGKQIIHLQPGTAILHNATWGSARIRVRPPYSKVWEPSAEDTRRLLGEEERSRAVVSGEAGKLLDLVRAHFAEEGHGIHLGEASRRLGITSKRRLARLVEELEQSGLVRTRKLRQRGQPRILEPISSGPPERVDETADQRRTEPDEMPGTSALGPVTDEIQSTENA